MIGVEVAINGSPAWLVTAARSGDGDDDTGLEGPLTYEVKVFDASGLETLRMEGGEPTPLAVTTVEHERADGALALAAAAAQAVVAAAGSGEIDQRLADRLRGR